MLTMKKAAILLGIALCAANVVRAKGGGVTTIQRFPSSLNADEAAWKGTLAELAKAPGAADEVWFSTGIAFPSLDWHRAFSKTLARHADDLRAIGILPGLEIQAVIGHGDSILALTGDMGGKTWTGWTDPDGVEAKTCNCPRQPAMRAYFVELARIYAAWKPSSVWLDDDFTTRGRTETPGCAFRGWRYHGCFCDLCVSTFARQEKRTFTRAELKQAIERDEALRNRWMAYSYDVLASLAEEIARAIHAVSPETRMGYQHGFNTRDNLQLRIFEALRRGSGHEVGSRPGGGAYRDEAPCWLVHKALEEGFQLRAFGQPEWTRPIVPEIENCPRTLTTKTAAGMRLEALCALGAGMNGLSYFAFDSSLESPAWAGRQVFGPIARDAEFFRGFIRANEGTRPCGLSIAPSAERVDPEAIMHGVPLLTAPGDGRGTYLTGEAAANATDAELQALLANGGLVIDGDALERLSVRGLTSAFGGLKAVRTPASVAERYTDDPLNAEFSTPIHRRFGTDSYFCSAPQADRVRVLGEYFAHGRKIGDGTLLVEHGGRRYALLGSAFWSGSLSSDRLLQLSRLADWASGDRLPVRIEAPAHVALFARVRADGAFASVVVCNARLDETEGIALRVRGVVGDGSFVWQEPGGRPVRLSGRRDGADFIVPLPKMAAWHAGVLKGDVE